jgi:adenosylcobinamide-phosphate guanylyltransferase
MADALVMCGGRGERLRASADAVEVPEKPLLAIAGTPMVDRVIDALAGAAPVEAVRAVVSPAAPDTRAHLRGRADDRTDFAVVETAGEGYVADLTAALDDPAVARPVVTAAADLPLLAPDAVEAALGRSGDGARDLAACVPVALKTALGVSADRAREPGAGADVVGPAAGRALAPTGLNVVGDGGTGGDPAPELVHAGWDARLAVNVNYAADAAVARRLATDGGDAGGSR